MNVPQAIPMALSTLDLSLFVDGSKSQRYDFASNLRQGLARHGFLKIVNHGISEEEISEAFTWVSL